MNSRIRIFFVPGALSTVIVLIGALLLFTRGAAAGELSNGGSSAVCDAFVAIGPNSHRALCGSSADKIQSRLVHECERVTCVWFVYEGRAYVTRDSVAVARSLKMLAALDANASVSQQLDATRVLVETDARRIDSSARQVALAIEGVSARRRVLEENLQDYQARLADGGLEGNQIRAMQKLHAGIADINMTLSALERSSRTVQASTRYCAQMKHSLGKQSEKVTAERLEILQSFPTKVASMQASIFAAGAAVPV